MVFGFQLRTEDQELETDHPHPNTVSEPMPNENLTCPICQQHFDSEEDRLAHERTAHQVNRTGPSVEDANTTVVEDRDRNTRRSA